MVDLFSAIGGPSPDMLGTLCVLCILSMRSMRSMRGGYALGDDFP